MNTLLLWDIDGTLINSGGAGERALQRSLDREFNLIDTFDWLDYFGRTDAWIARTILGHHHLEITPENIQRFLDGYLVAVGDEMTNPHARMLPGIPEILQAVSARKDMAQGLLTGNLRKGAEIKLGHFDLWRYFSFGAYADDSENRDELGPHAVARASRHHAVSYAADRVFVIGDTPHDIACGKAIGAQTIAVATGRHTAETLRTHGPSLVVECFTNAEGFFELLASPQVTLSASK